MKKKIISVTMPLVFVLAALVSPSLVGAVASSDSATTTSTTTTVTTTAASDDSVGRAARIAKYKQKLTTSVSDAIKLRVAARCVAAQGLLKVRVASNSAATKARDTAYSSIVTDLKNISKAAEAKGVSVQAINSDIPVLEAKILAFSTANAAYQQDLSDLAALDCKADPSGFQAALQAARSDQNAAFTAATAVRSYINDTIKPMLTALKAELTAQAEAKKNN